jgi:predicted N-acetyltransferase YhbS
MPKAPRWSKCSSENDHSNWRPQGTLGGALMWRGLSTAVGGVCKAGQAEYYSAAGYQPLLSK